MMADDKTDLETGSWTPRVQIQEGKILVSGLPYEIESALETPVGFYEKKGDMLKIGLTIVLDRKRP